MRVQASEALPPFVKTDNLFYMRVCSVTFCLLLMSLPVLHGQTAAQRENARLREEQLLRQTEELTNIMTRLERAEQRLMRLEAEMAQLRASNRTLEQKLTSLEANFAKDREALLDEVAQIIATSQRPTSQPTIRTPTPGGARPAQAQSPVSSTARQGVEYVVQRGDTLSSIVRKLAAQGIRTSVAEIAEANQLADPTRIRVGQKLIIPQR